MPPHLHPRSAATSTLFAGTLAASFIVVGIPHIFPCPRPRKGYADTEIVFDENGQRIRRRKTSSKSEEGQGATAPALSREVSGSRSLRDEAELFRQLEKEAKVLEMEKRECPVPKPTEIIGKMLGLGEGRISERMQRRVEGS